MANALRKMVPWSDVPSRGPTAPRSPGRSTSSAFGPRGIECVSDASLRPWHAANAGTTDCEEAHCDFPYVQAHISCGIGTESDKSPRKPRWHFVLGGPYSQIYDQCDRGPRPGEDLPRKTGFLGGARPRRRRPGRARGHGARPPGPNGAGKTTAVRILTTLLRPDAGHRPGRRLRRGQPGPERARVIGLSGQYAAVDENLTGRENL